MLSLVALIDSGAEDNLMDTELAKQLRCTIQLLEISIPALPLDKTSPVSLTISGNHVEELQFHLLPSPQALVVLGHPWLKRHNLHTDWLVRWIMG